MKKINIYLLGILLIFTGCQDLDINPLDTGSSGNWYSTQTEIEMSVKGLYRDDFWPISSFSWDDDNQERNSLSPITNGTISSEWSSPKTYWDNSYKAIARANIVLSKMDECVEAGIITREQGDKYTAEALFIRAQMYALLVTHFGDVVYITTTISLDEAYSIGRTATTEIIPKIYADFDDAAATLPLNYGASESLRATKGAAYALKARFALYMNDWSVAADAAKKCIDLGEYKLHPDFADLFVATTKRSGESIFLLPRSVELDVYMNTGHIQGFATRNNGGWASIYPSWDLFCSYLCTDGLPIDESPLFDPQKPFENRDPRCTATIVEFGSEHLGFIYDPHPQAKQVLNLSTGKMQTNNDSRVNAQYASFNGLVLKKGSCNQWIADKTWKIDPDKIIIRLADVYLMYAEAKIETGDIDQSVLDAINRVRARAYGVDYTNTTAYPAITTNNKSELRRIVRIERRMEFAYEGLRYMDLIRWRLAEKALNRPDYGMIEPAEQVEKLVNTGLWFFPETPAVDEDGISDFTSMYEKGYIKVITQRQFDAGRQYLWPIPSKELLINDNMKQNEGY